MSARQRKIDSTAWAQVTIKLQKAALPVVTAIAAAMTEAFDQPDEPVTDAQVLEAALGNGLLALEDNVVHLFPRRGAAR